jgi:hypothetical protein
MNLKILSGFAAARFAEHCPSGWTFGSAATKRRLEVCSYHRNLPAKRGAAD